MKSCRAGEAKTMLPTQYKQPSPEPAAGRPEISGEQWLGRNASDKRRLWERLNPRHRRMLRLVARACGLRHFRCTMTC